MQGHDLPIHHPSGLFTTRVGTGSPGTKWLLAPRFQLRLNLTRLTLSPLSSAALDELGPSTISQMEGEKIPFALRNMLHEGKHGASKDSVITWSVLSGQSMEHLKIQSSHGACSVGKEVRERIDTGGAWRLNQM